jgi:hypothetical protein
LSQINTIVFFRCRIRGSNLSGIKFAVICTVKLSLVTSPPISEAETRRQRGLHKQAAREHRVRFFGELHRAFVSGVRSVFIFLMGATVVVFICSHLTEINSIATHEAVQLAARVKAHTDASRLKQSDLNHEQEVNEITK